MTDFNIFIQFYLSMTIAGHDELNWCNDPWYTIWKTPEQNISFFFYLKKIIDVHLQSSHLFPHCSSLPHPPTPTVSPHCPSCALKQMYATPKPTPFPYALRFIMYAIPRLPLSFLSPNAQFPWYVDCSAVYLHIVNKRPLFSSHESCASKK